MLATVIALAAAAASQPSPAPAPAPADLATWVQQVERRVDDHMARPRDGASGMATVTFRRGEDGRPVDVKATSADFRLTDAAIRTIRAVGVLPPMPGTMPGNQRITFRFLVGMPGHLDEFDAARLAMRADATRANTALAARLGAQVQVAALERR